MKYEVFYQQLIAARSMLAIQNSQVYNLVDQDLEILATQLLCVYEDPWLHLDKPRYSPHFLYVGLVSQLPLRAEFAPRHCLCIADAPLPPSYSGESLRSNLLIVEMDSSDRGLMLLLNHAAFILADDIRYLLSFMQLTRAREQQFDPVHVIWLVEHLLDNPVLLIQKDQSILAKGSQFLFDHVQLNKEIESNMLQSTTLESIQFADATKLFEDGNLSELQYSGWRGGFLSLPIHIRGILTAVLLLQNSHSPYYESSLRLLEPIAELLARALDRQMSADSNRSLLHSLLFQELLSGKPTHELRQQLDELHWREERGMQLLCCRSNGPGKVEAVLTQLLHLLPGCRWTYMGETLLLLLYPEAVRDLDLRAVLQQHGLHGGISWPFDQLTAMPWANQQAQAAISQQETLQQYSRVFPAHIMTVPVEHLRHFVHPAILQLEQYDQTHDSAMLQTLDAVLYTPDQLSEVADRLFVHRNTLFYRMSRIRELCGVDLSNGEERVNLLLSLRILQGHGLISMTPAAH